MKVAHEVRNIIRINLCQYPTFDGRITFPSPSLSEQGAVLCLATDPSGALLASGGADGRVCLWQWGADQFLHQGDAQLAAFLRILDLTWAIYQFQKRKRNCI